MIVVTIGAADNSATLPRVPDPEQVVIVQQLKSSVAEINFSCGDYDQISYPYFNDCSGQREPHPSKKILSWWFLAFPSRFAVKLQELYVRRFHARRLYLSSERVFKRCREARTQSKFCEVMAVPFLLYYFDRRCRA